MTIAGAPSDAAALAKVPRLSRSERYLVLAFAVLASTAAWASVYQRRTMQDMSSVGAITFLLVWLTMMAAMMLPSVTPVAALWLRAIRKNSSGAKKWMRTLSFLGGYIAVWGSAGLLFLVLLPVTDRVASAGYGHLLAAAVFTVAGAYELSKFKRSCLSHCRSPLGFLMKYATFGRRLRNIRVGAHHGLFCLGCCGGLMLVLIPLGLMNVGAMGLVAATVLAEKTWRRGELLSKLVGVAMLAAAVAVLFVPHLVAPGLVSEMKMQM